jgi:hypothetical protein
MVASLLLCLSGYVLWLCAQQKDISLTQLEATYSEGNVVCGLKYRLRLKLVVVPFASQLVYPMGFELQCAEVPTAASKELNALLSNMMMTDGL